MLQVTNSQKAESCLSFMDMAQGLLNAQQQQTAQGHSLLPFPCRFGWTTESKQPFWKQLFYFILNERFFGVKSFYDLFEDPHTTDCESSI